MMLRKPTRPYLRTPLKCQLPASSSRCSRLSDASSPASFRKSSLWKEKFKQQCLDRARQKRQQMVHSRRISSPAMNDTLSPPDQTSATLAEDARMTSIDDERSYSYLSTPPKSCLASPQSQPPYVPCIADPNGNARNETLAKTARDLIQEELRFHHIGVSPTRSGPPSSPDPFHPTFDQNIPPPLFHSNTNIPTPADLHIHERMYEPASTEEPHILKEEELFELMREVEEELQQEEAYIAQEINEMEAQYLQEKLLLEEQIADFEMWQQQLQQDESHDFEMEE